MIVGSHAIIYSADAEADRAFLRDILKLPYVDVGGGWLVFGLPPAEVAVHPSEKNDVHELYFLCDDIRAFVEVMLKQQIPCEPVSEHPWGLLTRLTLPGGGKLGVYQPQHRRPPARKIVKPVHKKAGSSRGNPARKPRRKMR